MNNVHHVPFEPGLGSDPVMCPVSITVRTVAEVPAIAAIRGQACCEWFAAAQVTNLGHLRSRQPGHPPTRVAVLRDARRLFVAFHCTEPQMKKAHRLVPRDSQDGCVEIFPGLRRALEYDECVGLYLDPGNAKREFRLLQVNINGARLARRISSVMGWTVFPLQTPQACAPEPDSLTWESEVFEAGDHWRAALAVDLETLCAGADQPPTVGLNFARWRNVDLWRQYSWAPAVHLWHFPALALGDGYLTDSPARVTRIDWGTLEYGANRVRMALSGGGRACEVALRVTVRDSGEVGDPEFAYAVTTDSTPVELMPHGQVEVTAGFELPFEYPNVDVRLEMVERGRAGGFYRATFPLGNHNGLRVRQPSLRVARRTGAAAPRNPDPSDPDFHRRKRDFILSRLPRFRRRNTAGGAPSDFVLSAMDGSVAFDLMKPGALRRIADWIGSLFEPDTDRIVAVAMFTQDDWVTTHAAARVGLHTHLTPLSALRLGGGHCYSRAIVGAGLVSELPDPATGGRHRAQPTQVMGHVVVAVERGDDYVLFDPSFGHFFYNSSNTNLATARELANDPGLVSRVVKAPEKIRLYYACIPSQIRLEQGTVVWPADAPPA
ncbi:MAG: hypothetical protein K9N49_08530 [Candidatus Marinimicrobia bacterium]|nr:hypothetical protein [Candidatus Neomarinimicrobiota bacterium]